jgi:hypothetical protein
MPVVRAGDEWRRKLELLAALEVAVPAAAAAAHKVNKSKVLNKGAAVVPGFHSGVAGKCQMK